MSYSSENVRPLSVESDHAFEIMFYRNPLPMWIFDDDTLRILAVNDAAIAKYGWSREEFLRMTIEDLRPAEDVPQLRAYRNQVRDHPSPGLNVTIEWRHRTKTGQIMYAETTWYEIPYAGKNAVLVLNMDRSDQRRAEERAREQASLLDLASDAIIVRDLEHRVLYWNRGAERLYGWTAGQAMGARVNELVKTDEAAFSAALSELLECGSWSGQMRQVRRDGRELVVNSRWTLVRGNDGHPKSVLVINTDITETRQLEQQFLRAQRLEAIGTLASGIAHDLNNILSPILMSVSILRHEIKDEENQKLLNIIESSADRGAGIVKQVLTFARGVEGDRVLIQPKHLVTELSKIMAQTFPRNIDIQTAQTPNLWPVSGDATQLHQVLLNLCVNARDAMSRGGVLTVGAENVEVDQHFASMNPGAQLGPHVCLRVSDTGEGMPPEVVEKIFDPFFTTKEVGKGTGLGLATVMGIVKSHGGFLTVKSEVGVGTTFKVFLPASPQEMSTQTESPEISPLEMGRGQLVLVVDDETSIREALVRTLQQNGYRAYTAEDGTDALALYFARRDEIDLVLTDLSMGQMDGITLIRSLRKLDPKVRVIVSSGHLHKEQITILNSLGVNVFLDKPYTAHKLLRALQAVLSEVHTG